MAKISLKKDYTDGNVLYGKDLNPNFETIETALNNNDDTQSGINEEVNSNLAQLNSDVTQIKSDIVDIQGDITNIDSDITSGDNATLSAAQTYVDTKLQGYAETSDLPTSTSDLINDSGFVTAEDVPTKISELENDDHTVKDENYVHTDNNFSNTDKSKLDGLSNYELPTASDTVLGGIKVGDNLEITSDGVLNALGGGLTTLVGTEENPIALDTLTEAGIYHVSGYMKNNSDYGGIGEVVSKHDRILLVVRTGSDNRHISQLYYEGSPYKFRWYQRIGDIYTGMNSSFNAIDLVTQVDDSALGDTGGIITEYSLLAYIGKLTDLETTDKSNIVAAINEALESGGGGGGSGEDGATFTPSVSEDGTLSWTNDKGLPNPDPVNIKGPQGDPGEDGTDGANGQGVPTGGTAGQILSKNSATDYDTSWIDMPESGPFEVIDATGETEIDLDDYTDFGNYIILGHNVKQIKSFSSVPSRNCPFYILMIAEYYTNSTYVYQTIMTPILTGYNGGVSQGMWHAYRQISPNLDTSFSVRTFSFRVDNSFKAGTNSDISLSTYGARDLYNELVGAIGYTGSGSSMQAVKLNTLQTTNKSSLVDAINEVLGSIPNANKVPIGGTAGQVLTKNSATDYDMGWTDLAIGDNEPIGSIKLYGGTTAPNGYLFAQGQEVSRTTYSELFSVYGTSFGEGDGSTTFNLPNLKGKVVVGLDETDTDFNSLGKTGGSKTHTQTVAEMPSHTHSTTVGPWGVTSGGFYGVVSNNSGDSSPVYLGSTGNGQPMNIMNPYMVFNYIIKAYKTSSVPEDSEVKNVETDSTSDVYSCDYINDLTNMFDYSNEQIVGKWADGKPLYQKVFVVTDQNNINFDVSSLNIDTCCKLECVIDYVAVSNNYRYRRPLYCSTENQGEYFLAFLRDNTIQTRISSYLSSAIATFNKITYILTYTKTTD